MNAVHIDLMYRSSDESWAAAILDDRGIALWRSAERFRSADIAYYRAVGQFVLTATRDDAVDQAVGGVVTHAA